MDKKKITIINPEGREIELINQEWYDFLIKREGYSEPVKEKKVKK